MVGWKYKIKKYQCTTRQAYDETHNTPYRCRVIAFYLSFYFTFSHFPFFRHGRSNTPGGIFVFSTFCLPVSHYTKHYKNVDETLSRRRKHDTWNVLCFGYTYIMRRIDILCFCILQAKHFDTLFLTYLASYMLLSKVSNIKVIPSQ